MSSLELLPRSIAAIPRVALIATLCASALAQKAPLELTAEQDRRRALDLLDIPSLRRGVNARDPDAPNAANWDEAKANPYPDLPDPLVFNNGAKVSSEEQWRQRRAELFELFDREVYGRVPKSTPGVKWQVASVTEGRVAGVRVVTKQLLGHVDNSSYPAVTVAIEMTLSIPPRPRGLCR